MKQLSGADEARRLAIYEMWSARGGRVRLEPTQRRVRVLLGGVVVADSREAQLLYLPPPHNCYLFPRRDVREQLLQEPRAAESVPGLGELQRWSVGVADRLADGAAWTLPRPPAGLEQLTQLIGFDWELMDAWYEEDDEVFVHPRDPQHRVDVLDSSRHVKVAFQGELLAESRRPRLLFETDLPVRYYLPKLDVRLDLLERSQTSSRCPYKGVASYWSVRLGDQLHPDLAWTYQLPIPECPKIENLVCFFNERTDIEVDGERLERPRTPWSRD